MSRYIALRRIVLKLHAMHRRQLRTKQDARFKSSVWICNRSLLLLLKVAVCSKQLPRAFYHPGSSARPRLQCSADRGPRVINSILLIRLSVANYILLYQELERVAAGSLHYASLRSACAFLRARLRVTQEAAIMFDKTKAIN